jgi:hypothetical protein
VALRLQGLATVSDHECALRAGESAIDPLSG